jgi:hypothetical protein
LIGRVSGLNGDGYYRGILLYALGPNCEEIWHLHCVPEQEVKGRIERTRIIGQLGYDRELTEFGGTYILNLSGRRVGSLRVDTPSSIANESFVQTILKKSGYKFS